MLTAHGRFKDVAVIRLDAGEDVFDGILGYCTEAGIRNGVVLALHGSLQRAAFYNVAPRPDLEMKYGYTNPMFIEDICELISASGTVTHEESGNINLHIHCTYSDRQGNAYGGHLIPGNKVLLVTEAVIGVVDGIDMLGIRNESGGVLFTPAQQ